MVISLRNPQQLQFNNFSLQTTAMGRFHFQILAMAAILISGTEAEKPENDPLMHPSEYSTASEKYDSSSYPVYQMTNFFLEKIIQPFYLTKMEEYLDTPDDFIDSWHDYWDEWLLYGIGFVICACIGILLIVVMFIICCCCCCCKNGCCCCQKKKKKTGYSKGCCISCTVVMAFIFVALVLAVIPMFAMNDRLNKAAKDTVWETMNTSLDSAYSFLTQSVDDADKILYQSYVTMQDGVIDTLFSIPTDAMEVLNNATGLVTAVKQVDSFANELQDLLRNLTEADELTKNLQALTTTLQQQLNDLVSQIINSTECMDNSPPVCSTVENIILVADFSQLNLTPAVDVADDAIESGFVDLIANISLQTQEMLTKFNETIYPHLTDCQDQMNEVGDSLSNILSDFNETVSTIDVSGVQNDLTEFKMDETFLLVITIVYWSIFSLIILLTVIAALLFLGLLFGIILPYKKADVTKKACCDKSCGSGWINCGTGIVYVFYWFYLLLLLVLFIVGGMFHTEACRHVTRINDENSFAVLEIFDDWMNTSFYNETGKNIPILPFDSYKLCSQDSSLYIALHLEEEWNLTEIADDTATEITNATNEIKNIDIIFPHVKLTDPTVIEILLHFDEIFSEFLNFTEIFENIERDIVQPNLTIVIEDLHKANFMDFAAEMQNISDNIVLAMESNRTQLIKNLKAAEKIINGVSFLNISHILNTSEIILNANGTDMVSKFVNTTADTVAAILIKYTYGTTNEVSNNMSRCGSLYDAGESTLDAICVYILYPINGFWFCLGWYTFFLFIGLCISPKLADLYRADPTTNRTNRYTAEDTGDADIISAARTAAAVDDVSSREKQAATVIDTDPCSTKLATNSEKQPSPTSYSVQDVSQADSRPTNTARVPVVLASTSEDTLPQNNPSVGEGSHIIPPANGPHSSKESTTIVAATTASLAISEKSQSTANPESIQVYLPQYDEAVNPATTAESGVYSGRPKSMVPTPFTLALSPVVNAAHDNPAFYHDMSYGYQPYNTPPPHYSIYQLPQAYEAQFLEQLLASPVRIRRPTVTSDSQGIPYDNNGYVSNENTNGQNAGAYYKL